MFPYLERGSGLNIFLPFFLSSMLQLNGTLQILLVESESDSTSKIYTVRFPTLQELAV